SRLQDRGHGDGFAEAVAETKTNRGRGRRVVGEGRGRDPRPSSFGWFQAAGSTTERSLSTERFLSTCRRPDGHSITSRSASVAPARPKCTTVSLPEESPTDPQKTSRSWRVPPAVTMRRAPQPSRLLIVPVRSTSNQWPDV